MRVLFAAPYVPSLIRVRPYHLIRELARRHQVTVLASGSGAELQAAEALRAVCHRVEVVPRRLGASLRSCAMAAWRGEPLQAAVCRSRELEARLRALLREERFDLVHVEHLRAAHLHSSLPHELPTVFDAVDCISLLLERTRRASHCRRQRAIAWLELGRTQRYEAALLTRFDEVTVTSPDDARALRALNPTARLSIVPNGVDLDYFRPLDRPREAATLVLSGKMSYHANVSAALYFVGQIFPLVRAARPDVRLRIVGSDPPRAVRALAADPAISVTGSLPDLRAALGTASLAVCPMTVKVGIQNKLLEAMAMGLPVVATRAGVEGLAAEAGRDLFVADGPAEFARQVSRLLADPALREHLGRAGRRYVERQHRWADAAGQLEACYREAIAGRAARAGRDATRSSPGRYPLRAGGVREWDRHQC